MEGCSITSNQEAVIFWEKGVKVLIQGGKYKIRNGVIIKVTTKMAKVDIVGLGEKYVKKENMAIDEIKPPSNCI